MKPRIHKNVWDNWYGYLGRKRVISFCNSPTETQEQQAKRWLKEQEFEKRCREMGCRFHKVRQTP